MAPGKRADVDEVENLVRAAQELIKPPTAIDDDDINRQLVALGLAPTFKSAQQDLDVWVLPENWPAIQLLTQCKTQWKKTVIASMAGVKVIHDGLDYTAVEILMRLYWPDEDAADLFGRLQVLEAEAVKLMNAD